MNKQNPTIFKFPHTAHTYEAAWCDFDMAMECWEYTAESFYDVLHYRERIADLIKMRTLKDLEKYETK